MSGLCTTCGHNGENCIIFGLNTELSTRLIQQTEENKYFILTNDRVPFCGESRVYPYPYPYPSNQIR